MNDSKNGNEAMHTNASQKNCFGDRTLQPTKRLNTLKYRFSRLGGHFGVSKEYGPYLVGMDTQMKPENSMLASDHTLRRLKKLILSPNMNKFLGHSMTLV